MLNSAAITEQHAVEHLAVNLTGYQADIAVITETHLKEKHVVKNSLCADNLFRRNRVGRRGGGTANYVSDRLLPDVWTCPGNLSTV